MEMIEFLKGTKLYVGFSFEVMACIAGFIYLKKKQSPPPGIKVFIYYLLFVVIFEFYGFLPIYAYVNDYEVLGFFKDSLFRRNLWTGNVMRIATTVSISLVFIYSLKNSFFRRYLKILLWVFSIFSIIWYISFGMFFQGNNPVIDILGTFIILVCVGFYYFDILKSGKILNFYTDIRFYISVGITIWGLCIMPLKIYGDFFSLENPYFIEVHTTILRYFNVFMYSLFTVGFYIDYKTQHSMKKLV